MSITSDYNIQLIAIGDFEYTQQFAGETNTLSPAVVNQVSLASGTNTITVPSTLARSVTIIPPTSNTLSLTVKSTTADTGWGISKVSPTLLTFTTTGTTQFYVVTGGTVGNTRFVFL